jgi:hypothetical protein
MTTVLQPKGSRICGQACVATLLGISLEHATKLVSKKGATNLKHLIPPLLMSYNCSNVKLMRTSPLSHWTQQVPKIAIMRVRWSKSSSHWVVKDAGSIHDPVAGELGINDFDDLITHHGGRVTSYFQLEPKLK